MPTRTEKTQILADALRSEYSNGIVAGLEMAEKFLALTRDRKYLAAMIKVAIATAKG